MDGIQVKDIVGAVKGSFIYGDPVTAVRSVSTDTRTLGKGDLFFALKGRNFDGHKFIINAVREGAAGLVVERLDEDFDRSLSDFSYIPAIIRVDDTLRALGDFAGYYRRRYNPEVVCITGSNGKTTTKDITAAVLSAGGLTLSNKGSFNNCIGLPMTLFELTSGHSYCVLELGISLQGEMERLIEISAPKVGIITNIGRTHLEFLGDSKGVFNEKKKLAESLPPDGKVILNADDKFLKELAGSIDCEVVTFGLDESASVYADEIRMSAAGTRLRLHYGKDSIPARLPFPGKYNVYNALAAAAAGLSMGMGLTSVLKAVETVRLPSMRMEKTELRGGTVIVNDAYNANPDSMREAILSFVKMYPDREKIIVLGDMMELGERSGEEHSGLGDFLGVLPAAGDFLPGRDSVLLYGRHASAVHEGIGKRVKSVYFESMEELIADLGSRLKKAPAVFLKASRSMGFERIVQRLLEKKGRR